MNVSYKFENDKLWCHSIVFVTSQIQFNRSTVWINVINLLQYYTNVTKSLSEKKIINSMLNYKITHSLYDLIHCFFRNFIQ